MITRTRMYEKVMALSTSCKGTDVSRDHPVKSIKIPPEAFVDRLPVPMNYDDTVTGPYREYWIPTIATELRNLQHYKVWRKQKLSKGIIPVRGRFVFKWKPDSENHLERAKARFTMQGCTQIKHLHTTRKRTRLCVSLSR